MTLSAVSLSGNFKVKDQCTDARSIGEALQIVDEKNVDAIVCSEAVPATIIEDLSKAVSAFCASRGTMRPPLIALAKEGEFERLDRGLSDLYVDRVLPECIEMSDLMVIVSQAVRSAISWPRITGSLGRLDIFDVVQMILLSGQELVLEVISRENIRCLLYISNGRICHAKCGSLEGEDAAHLALGLRSGSFVTLPCAEPERTTIDKPAEMVLLEAARKRDEKSNPSPDADPDASI